MYGLSNGENIFDLGWPLKVRFKYQSRCTVLLAKFSLVTTYGYYCGEFFTKRLPFCKSLSYAECLTYLKLQSLEHRRMIFDLILVFKIIHGFTCLNFDDFFSFANNNRSSRGHPFRLYIPINKNNTCHFFFSSRVILVWNSLPDILVSAPNPISFKKALIRHDLSKFLHFPSFFAWVVFFSLSITFSMFLFLLLICLFYFGYT